MSIPWTKNICIDVSIMFHIKSNYKGFAFDDWLDGFKISERPKSIDLLIAPESRQSPDARWLVEVKDFRQLTSAPQEKNTTNLHDYLEKKFRGTIEVLCGQYKNNIGEENQQELNKTHPLRCVVHIEMPPVKHPAFPSGYPGNAFQKLKPLIKDIDPSPLLLSSKNNSTQTPIPWSVNLLTLG